MHRPAPRLSPNRQRRQHGPAGGHRAHGDGGAGRGPGGAAGLQPGGKDAGRELGETRHFEGFIGLMKGGTGFLRGGLCSPEECHVIQLDQLFAWNQNVETGQHVMGVGRTWRRPHDSCC